MALRLGSGRRLSRTLGWIGSVTHNSSRNRQPWNPTFEQLELRYVPSATYSVLETSPTVSETGVTITLHVTRAVADSTYDETIHYDTSGGDGIAGVDYTSLSGTLSFPNGVSSQTVTIPVFHNGIIGDRTFDLYLSDPSNGGTANMNRPVTITNVDDGGVVSFNPTTYTVNSDKGNEVLTLTRVLSTTLPGFLLASGSVSFSTADGTAVAPTDYGSRSFTASFTAGQTLTTVSVPIANHNFVGSLSFGANIANLSSPIAANGATVNISAASAIVTIIGVPKPSQTSTPNQSCGCVNSPTVVLVFPIGIITNLKVTSANPIGYSDGLVQMAATDLTSTLGGSAWGVNRSWSNDPGYSDDSDDGNGWVNAEMPYLEDFGDTVVAINNANSSRFFSVSDDTYTASNYDPSQLTHNTTSHTFTLTDGAGASITYSDFSDNWPTDEQGQFKAYTDASGNTTSVQSTDESGRATEVQRSDGTPLSRSSTRTSAAA